MLFNIFHCYLQVELCFVMCLVYGKENRSDLDWSPVRDVKEFIIFLIVDTMIPVRLCDKRLYIYVPVMSPPFQGPYSAPWVVVTLAT